jgi:HNH endonuclease
LVGGGLVDCRDAKIESSAFHRSSLRAAKQRHQQQEREALPDFDATADISVGIVATWSISTIEPNNSQPSCPLNLDRGVLCTRSLLRSSERKALIRARLGQGRFRADLLEYWGGCAVVGCTVEAALRASHIKPWRESSDRERLDPANGLLLIANLDALFNDGLITFDDDGRMLLSNQLTRKDRSLLRLKGKLKKRPSPRQRKYLRLHRNREFH